MMVLFLTSDPKENAMQAVRTAQAVIEKACVINDTCSQNSQHCLVNVGVSSGQAFVGAAKFESLTGSRWTYTTHGNMVNIAARLCGRAKGGEVLLSKETVERTKGLFQFSFQGKVVLKNFNHKQEVYTLVD